MTNTDLDDSRTMFLDPKGRNEIARYDRIKYPQFEKLRKKQTGYFWQPEEIQLPRDGKDFRKLTDHEQHIFTSNIYRQIVLDTKQGRSVSEVLAPIATLPEIEAICHTWNYFETIHSESYTHIIRSIYSNPSEVLDGVLSIEPIVECAKSIAAPYEELADHNLVLQLNHASPEAQQTNRLNHKRALWKCLMAINALEGIRFYVSFACSWAFAETKRMEGNAKIIKMIARDENIHLAVTQQMIKLLPQDDPDFAVIREEEAAGCRQMFIDVVQQEIDWAGYLFKDGSMIGLNEALAVMYMKWLGNKRASAIGMEPLFADAPTSNPLPWTQKWIAGSDVQVAPQETENSSYIINGFTRNISPSKFKNFEL